MVYIIVIVSSSTSAVQNKHYPMNIIFTIFVVWSKGCTLSCMTLNSSRNTHISSCSCWKSSAYDNGVFKGIHHWKNRHASLWATLEKPVPVLISLIWNPHACFQATETVAILEPKAIINIFIHCVWHLQKIATNVLIYTLQNIINTIKQPFEHGIDSCNKNYSNISNQTNWGIHVVTTD